MKCTAALAEQGGNTTAVNVHGLKKPERTSSVRSTRNIFNGKKIISPVSFMERKAVLLAMDN